MLVLLRNIRIRRGKVLDQRDLEMDCHRLRLGSGRQQDIQLFGARVGAEHALLWPDKDGLNVRCRDAHRVLVDASPARRTRLAIGQWARIGGHQLRPIEPPPGFDAAIEIHIDADASPAIKQRLADEFVLRLPRARPWAWLMVVLVAGLSLGLPMLGYYREDAGNRIAAWGGPTDALWSSGPLFSGHHLQQTAQECRACHLAPFESVQNQACLECHQDITRHFAADHPMTGEFSGRCAGCHKEHNEPGTLIVRRPALCTDCHAEPLQRHVSRPSVAPERLNRVTAFSDRGHPEFLVSLLRPAPAGWRVERERLGAPTADESSQLKFSHLQHLDFEQVSLADGPSHEDRALVCADCHTLDPAGEHFQPITMEATCRGCHSLAFDDALPDRQLPHGEPEMLRVYLEEYFVRQAALARTGPPPASARRVPNQRSAYRCEGEPLECGRFEAVMQMAKLFAGAGCVSCHEVVREEGEWRVRPVRLVSDWFPQARFDHRPHLNTGLEVEEGQCARCHAAAESEHGTDVLMPSRKVCTDCHGDTVAANVPLQCLDCHSFHRPGLERMAPERK